MKFDRVIVGGGLQAALIALATLRRAPATRVAIVERGARLGGEHTWCFHEADVPDAEADWIEPLVVARWSAWDVRFPGFSRTFPLRYAAIDSARLDAVVTRALDAADGCAIFRGRAATSIRANAVTLDDGRTLEAPLVIDARGPEPLEHAAGQQKFVGLELELSEPCAIDRPIVMDATVDQHDGLRFFYVLPFTPTRVLVEETFFSDDGFLDAGVSERRIRGYARALGLSVAREVRSERGVLPLPWSLDFAPSTASPLVAGYRGGWFHPTTGYSLPVALRLATHLATTPVEETFGAAWRRLTERHAREARYATMLNRLLFGATDPAHRRDVLERFHRMPAATVARFYALASTPTDRLRILCGAPPRGVSLLRAFESVVAS